MSTGSPRPRRSPPSLWGSTARPADLCRQSRDASRRVSLPAVPIASDGRGYIGEQIVSWAAVPPRLMLRSAPQRTAMKLTRAPAMPPFGTPGRDLGGGIGLHLDLGLEQRRI